MLLSWIAATTESHHIFYLYKINHWKEKELTKDFPLPHGVPCTPFLKDLKKKYREKLRESVLGFCAFKDTGWRFKDELRDFSRGTFSTLKFCPKNLILVPNSVSHMKPL